MKQKRQDLRKVFIEQYGVQMEVPVYYFKDAKFVPHYSDHIVQTAFHIAPSADSFTVQNTYLDHTYDNTTIDEIYKIKG